MRSITFILIMLAASGCRSGGNSAASSAKDAVVPDPCASNIVAQQAGAYWNFSYKDSNSGALTSLFQSEAFSKYSTCGNILATTGGAYIFINIVDQGKAKYILRSDAFEHVVFLYDGGFAVSAGAYYNLYNAKGEYVSQVYQNAAPFDHKSAKWFKPS